MKIALIQMNSGDDIGENIARAQAFVDQAAAAGAVLAALPENAFDMPAPGKIRQLYTQQTHPGLHAASSMARLHNLWLLAGSVAVLPDDPAQQAGKTYNRSVLFDPKGEIAAHYDKIHLFDVDVGDGHAYHESARFLPGDKAVTFAFPEQAILGMTVCYDLRFPHLYRALAKAGANLLAVPSAFTQVTGEAHWHVLLRARAIENGCYVIAPAQCGTHAGGRQTFGHSLIVGPWGEVIADGGTEPGIIVAELDFTQVDAARRKLPSLEHDREFSYG